MIKIVLVLVLLSQIEAFVLLKSLQSGNRIDSGFSWAKLVGSLGAGSLLLINGQPAFATETRQVGNIETSGLLFKDTLKVTSFADPKLPTVHLFLADFERPLAEKLSKDFFNDPSSSSLSCVMTAPPNAKDLASLSTSDKGEEVFEESKNLIFKSIKVRRVYDKDTNTAVYASYSTRFDKGDDANKSRFKSSLCAVNLNSISVGGM